MLIQELMIFFQTLIFPSDALDYDGNGPFADLIFSIGGVDMSLSSYLTLICSIISIIIILVLCCLFIGKIIKTISRLFMGA